MSSEPTTPTGRALAAKTLPGMKDTILAIEAEVRTDLEAKVRALPLYDPDDRITAMDGTVREPRTMADAVEVYRTRVLRLLTDGAEPPKGTE